ncbi:hypothetical protein PLESTB_001255100 [Pleodorina starrii]|uniref:Structural maintenance of chromosomes protein 5 n=1 Tax=Pleodorina starrii TaxID=330485 RepID=A0A9W6BT24_9CHLO|nr:hypothetical protein PLESTM_000204900 [Pleodorina starrii]GLC57699.1 hypothetical protein PLESTB_001255100 [Pleodorina starrii]GLC63368.1 hypothetical protein PLESTF_000028900 [Pleodorina starrii]
MPSIKREREEAYESDNETDGEDDLEDANDEEEPAGAESEEEEPAAPSGSDRRPVFFTKGSVKLVKMHDFMTYNGTVVVRPGPRLNLVLGPNGTGKSSLVCALCLGLNGSPKTLGRADDIKAFVRRGARSFWTEITLSSGGEGRDYVIRRTVSLRRETDASGQRKDRFESKWKINGADSTSKDVDKLIRRLNIQFDNLCQFLPQDKVSEFAKMDQYELLTATLMAVGDASLYEQHQQLIQLRKDEVQQTAERNAAVTRLEKLKNEHERQRRDYERFQQREKLLEEARSLHSQARWLEVLAKGRAAEAAKQRRDKKREALRALEDQQQEQTRPLREREEAVKEIRQSKTASDREAKDADQRMRRIADKLAKNDVDIVALADEMSSLDSQAKERAGFITVARQRLEKAQADLASAPEKPPQELYDRTQELRALIQASIRESSDVEAQQNNLSLQIQTLQGQIGRVQGRLDLLNSRKHQMLQRLGQVHRNIGLIHGWVEQHRTDGTFRGPVYGPVALELSVKAASGLSNSAALQYVENTCWQWLASYIVMDKADEALLNKQARQMGVAATVRFVHSSADPREPLFVEHPAGPAGQHAGYGIVHTVDELVEAEPIFMRVLIRQCKANLVYIGTEQTVSCMEALARDTRINTVLVGNTRMNVVRSRYNTSVRNVENGELYQPRLLGAGGGSEEDAERAGLHQEGHALVQERDRLSAEMEQLAQELQRKEQQRQAWDAEIGRLHAQHQAILQKRSNLVGQVRNAERYLRTQEARPDPELRRPELRRSIEEKISEIATLSRQVLTAMQALWTVLRRSEVLELRLQEAAAQLNALRANRDKREKDLQAARNLATAAEEAFKSAQDGFKRAKEDAAENHPLSEADKGELKRHDEEKTSPSDLRASAEKKAAEADQVVCNNQNVADEFRRRQNEITQLTEGVQHHDTRCQELRGRIEEVQSVWLPEIRKMVSTINGSFANNFKEIGCAGEVRLHEDADFEKYAIQILVQFRAHEDMQLLTGTRQSGGERSVSTILYLIALQGVTETPFRVVDEINQGMDPINERKVYKQLVAASTEEHTPQCFLLTPKLLSNLTYSRDIHTLIIYSSAEMEEGLPATFTTADMWG